MQIDPKMNPNTLFKNSIDVTRRDGASATKAPNMHAPSLNNTFPNPNQRTRAIDVPPDEEPSGSVCFVSKSGR